jgi:hypothetical protein
MFAIVRGVQFSAFEEKEEEMRAIVGVSMSAF